MSKARQLADLLDSNGDVVVGALDNAPDPDLTPYATTTYVDSEISNVDLSTRVATSGDTMTGTLNFGDNVKAQFGASNDLQIYHDGSNSYVAENSTGNLYLQGTNIHVTSGDGTDNYINCYSNGAVDLRHNNNIKLSTTSTGVSITGNLSVSGSIAGAGKVLQVVKNSYNSRYSSTNYTNAVFSPQGRGVGYNNNVKMQHSINKQSSTSHLYVRVRAYLKVATNGHGIHGFLIWKDSTNYFSSGENWHDVTTYNGPFLLEYEAIFTGLGTGSHTFFGAPARSDGTAFGCVLNPNSGDVGGGHVPLGQNASFITITEVEV